VRGTTVDTPAVEIPRQAWVSLAIVSAAMFMSIVDLTVLNVSFPYIERTFAGTPRTTLAWLSSGYAIMLASLLMVSGRLADNIGRRRVFFIGVSVYGSAAVLTALAPNVTVMIATRLAQGVGAAMMTATAIALVLPLFPPSRRGLAIGIWGTVGSFGAAVGPSMGAAAIELSSWRLAFGLLPPFAVVTLVFGPRVLAPDGPVPAERRSIDLAGAALGSLAVALLTLSILQGSSWGWHSPAVIACAVAAVVLLVAFRERSRRAAHPIVDPALFRHRPFTVANVSQFGTQTAIFAWFFITPLFLVNVWHYSALSAGSSVAIGMVVSFVSIPVGHHSDRHGYRKVLVTGGLVSVAGMLWWITAVGDTPAFWTRYVPGLVVFGFGAGMVGIVVTNAALAGLPESELATANAAFQTVRRLAGAIGVAIAIALLGNRAADTAAAFRRTWWLIAVGYVVSVVAIAFYPEPGGRPAAAQESPALVGSGPPTPDCD
jgi:EmrB/QacA subfamily drug resistance transporter